MTVLGIFGLGSILAIVLGYLDRRNRQQSGQTASKLARAGVVIGWCGLLITINASAFLGASHRVATDALSSRRERQLNDQRAAKDAKKVVSTTSTTQPPTTTTVPPTTLPPTTVPPTTRPPTTTAAPRLITPADTENNNQVAIAYVRQQAPTVSAQYLDEAYLIGFFERLCSGIANAYPYGDDAPRQLIEALYRNSGETPYTWVSAAITAGVLSTCPGDRAVLQYVR